MPGAFPLDDIVVHGDAAIVQAQPLTIVTPAGQWAYAVSIPANWPSSSGWLDGQDGTVDLTVRVLDGAIEVLAVDETGTGTIDTQIVSARSEAHALQLMAAPLGACRTIVIRNARADGLPSRAAVDAVECVVLGPAARGDTLDAPRDLALRSVVNWSRFYGGGDSAEERLRSARYSRLSERKQMSWVLDLTVHIQPNDDLSRALYVSGLYEPSTMLVLRRVLGSGGVFVDAGANVGLFSMVASRWVGAAGRVYAFEPSEREYARLVDHLAMNQLTNVVPVRQALGNREGMAQLRVASIPNAGHNTLGTSFAYPQVRADRTEVVEATTLDRFVERHEVTRVDAVKLDVEGSEAAVLSGSRAVLERFRPVLFVELSTAALARCGTSAELVVQRLIEAGYRLCSIADAAELVPLASSEAASNSEVVAVPIEKGLV